MSAKLNTGFGPLLKFRGVGLKLGGNLILEKISFQVEPGAIHCLIGPNGGGKTSLIRCLLGQMPHMGEIRINWGQNQVTGYVPQALDFDRTLPLTVENFMTLICQNRPVFSGMSKISRKMIKQGLALVGMEAKKGYLFGGLSGGERQRVLLAQALMPEPGLLILDEPATGLDRTGSIVMRSLLEKLKAKGATILMIHHDLAEVKELADQVTCLNQNLVFTGKPAEELTPQRVMRVFSCKQAA